jgi:D-amino-acid dehydrogenase
MSAGRAVVIGGGIIGTACAHFLHQAGWQTTIIEQAAFGKGCSHGNCGFICPSHVLPLAEPGAIWKTMKALFQRRAPFYIRPRFDLALWSWLLHFAGRCNAKDMTNAANAIAALLRSSRRLYDEIIAQESLQCEWQTRGLLYVLQTERGMDHFARTVDRQRRLFDVRAVRYDGDAVVALEPALKPGLAGGWLFPDDAHLRPDRLLSSWRSRLEARGVTVLEDCGLRGFRGAAGRAEVAQTANGEMSADAFVVATGAWTPLLQRQLGGRIPIQPGKGYSMTMPRPARCPDYPLLFDEHRVAVTPLPSGYRLGSTMEFCGYDESLPSNRLDYLRRAAAVYLAEPECGPIREEWYGWRPMTFDSVPIIDFAPRWSNVVIAAGHNMLGMSMAPATGRLVAELLSREKPHLDVRPYCVGRF